MPGSCFAAVAKGLPFLPNDNSFFIDAIIMSLYHLSVLNSGAILYGRVLGAIKKLKEHRINITVTAL